MNKKRKLFLTCTLCMVFVSCRSVMSPGHEYKPLDYTEEDVVQEEIKRIRQLEEDSCVKALWRCMLLLENAPDLQISHEIYEECIAVAVDAYAASLEEKNYIESLRLYMSLKACGQEEKLSSSGYGEKDLRKLMEAGIQALAGNKSTADSARVSSFVSGTVTVIVDKGIKIENGYGYADGVLGSGFFISSDGYIITNHHVIQDCVDPKYEGVSRLYIKLAEDSDTRIPAKVVGYDSIIDLALIKAEIQAPYTFVLGTSNSLEAGDRVYAIGSPLGLERTLTSGIISSTDRRLFTCGTVFQLDAAINSGNSGGPMIDQQGNVQAVVFAGVQNYQGLNFAIPVEYLRQALPFLYAGGKREHAWTGAYGKTKRLPLYGAAGEGVTVAYDMPGGSLWLSGIREGDTIIRINDRDVHTLDDLQNYIMECPVRTIVKITVLDPQEAVSEHLVYLEQRPENPGYQVFSHDLVVNSMLPLIGLKLVPSSSSKKNYCTVVAVQKGSPAEDFGFLEGDTVQVLSVNADRETGQLAIQLYAKKRQSGFIDAVLGFTVSMDSPYYF